MDRQVIICFMQLSGDVQGNFNKEYLEINFWRLQST